MNILHTSIYSVYWLFVIPLTVTWTPDHQLVVEKVVWPRETIHVAQPMLSQNHYKKLLEVLNTCIPL